MAIEKLNKYKKSISNVRKNGCLDVLNERYSNLLSERYEAYNLSNQMCIRDSYKCLNFH